MEGRFGQRYIAPVGKVVDTAGQQEYAHPPTLTGRRGLIWTSCRRWGQQRRTERAEARWLQEAVLLHQQLGGLGEVYGNL